MNTSIGISGISFLRKRLYIGVSLAIILIGFDAIANNFSWYWIFRWLDNPMHIFGGLIASYFGILLWYIYKWFKSGRVATAQELVKNSSVIIPGLIVVLIMGISWEILEYAFDLSGLDFIHRADTIMDIINDVLGGILAIIIWKLTSLAHKNTVEIK